jgi:heme-degrading monooxygenase HmoA
MSVIVMVSARVKPGAEKEFEAAFQQVRATVSGTVGHLGDDLFKLCGEDNRYALVGRWESVERFLAWEESPEHRQATTPMRPYWAGAVDRRVFISADVPELQFAVPAAAARN